MRVSRVGAHLKVLKHLRRQNTQAHFNNEFGVSSFFTF